VQPKLDYLPEKTRVIYRRLLEEPLMQGMTLVGGSALALQTGHRISEDLDFAIFGAQLPSARIDTLISGLETAGFDVSLTTSQSDIERFRINTGRKLLNFVRDYAVDGVKLTFFARGANAPQKQLDWLNQADRLAVGAGFDILGLHGLFAMKSLVLADRARSRDLFDLMYLIEHCGYTIDQSFALAQQLAPVEKRDIERHKGVMSGIIPLDDDDEGFASINVQRSIAEIYAFLAEQIDAFEQRQAEEILRR